MYSVIWLVSFLIRQFCLPNPFECFGDYAFVINILAELVLIPTAYRIVGAVYERNSAPALGSLLFLIVYAMLNGILYVMGEVSFAWWSILILVVSVGALVVGIKKLAQWLDYRRTIETN